MIACVFYFQAYNTLEVQLWMQVNLQVSYSVMSGGTWAKHLILFSISTRIMCVPRFPSSNWRTPSLRSKWTSASMWRVAWKPPGSSRNSKRYSLQHLFETFTKCLPCILPSWLTPVARVTVWTVHIDHYCSLSVLDCTWSVAQRWKHYGCFVWSLGSTDSRIAS